MISRLVGELSRIDSERVTILVNNIGYEVYLPQESSSHLSNTEHLIDLYIYMNQSEYRNTLYGFANLEQKTIFEKLINVKGLGIKVIFNIIHSFKVQSMSDLEMISINDLTKVNGVGKTTAQKIFFAINTLLKKDSFVSNTNNAQNEGDVLSISNSFKEEIEAVCQLGIERKIVEMYVEKNYKVFVGKDSQEIVKILIKELA